VHFNFERWLLIVAFGFLQKFSLEAQYVHPFNICNHKSHDFSTDSAFSTKLIPLPHNSAENIYPKVFLSYLELNQTVYQLSKQPSGSENYNRSKSSVTADLIELKLSQNSNPDPNLVPILPDLLLDFDPNDFLERETFIPSSSYHFLKELNSIEKPLHREGSKELENYNSLASYLTFEFGHSMNQHLLPAMLYSGSKKFPGTRSPNIQTDQSTSKDTRPKEKSFKIQTFFYDYPQFLPKSNSAPAFYYDIFSSSTLEPIARLENKEALIYETLEDPVNSIQSSRQRRNNWATGNTYEWEIDDFSPGADFKLNEPTNFATAPSSIQKFNLSIIANGGIDSLAVMAYGMTGGNALNDYAGTSGFNFLTATGWDASGDVTNSFNLITSGSGGNTGIDAWLNGFDGYTQPTDLWGVHKNGNELYLTYEFSNLNFTPVPEPSTYFMTGALFCLIGCNRTSRRSLKKFIFHFFKKTSTKENCTEVENQVS
jgi:hypothetical protein